MFFKKIVIFCLLIFIAFVFTNCGAAPLKQKAFNTFQEHFESIETDTEESFHVLITLKNIKVHVVSDKSLFEKKEYREKNSGVMGYATSGNELWVLGKIVKKDGKKIIVINQAILGHEFNHILNFKNQIIINPDELDKFCP